MHPFSRARERTRALNAAKMERIFAKPFVASLEGHVDAVEVMCRKPKSLTGIASASWDGGVCVCFARGFWIEILTFGADIILHDLQTQTHAMKIRGAHKGKTSGLCFSGEYGERLLSCGVDRNVKLWDVTADWDADSEVRLVHSLRCCDLTLGRTQHHSVYTHQKVLSSTQAPKKYLKTTTNNSLAQSTITALTHSSQPHPV